jgi:hypothetical protein
MTTGKRNSCSGIRQNSLREKDFLAKSTTVNFLKPLGLRLGSILFEQRQRFQQIGHGGAGIDQAHP